MAPRTPKSQPTTFDEIAKAKQPKVVPVPITLDPNSDTPKVVEFKISSIGREAWETLVREHAPTDEQQAAHKAEQQAAGVAQVLLTSLRWDFETFPQALVAAACIEPVMTVEQASTLWTDPQWSPLDSERLFQAALDVNDPNQAAVRASLGKGSTPTGRSETS